MIGNWKKRKGTFLSLLLSLAFSCAFLLALRPLRDLPLSLLYLFWLHLLLFSPLSFLPSPLPPALAALLNFLLLSDIFFSNTHRLHIYGSRFGFILSNLAELAPEIGLGPGPILLSLSIFLFLLLLHNLLHRWVSSSPLLLYGRRLLLGVIFLFFGIFTLFLSSSGRQCFERQHLPLFQEIFCNFRFSEASEQLKFTVMEHQLPQKQGQQTIFHPQERTSGVLIFIDSLRTEIIQEDVAPELSNLIKNSPIRPKSFISNSRGTDTALFSVLYGSAPDWRVIQSVLDSGRPSDYLDTLRAENYSLHWVSSGDHTYWWSVGMHVDLISKQFGDNHEIMDPEDPNWRTSAGTWFNEKTDLKGVKRSLEILEEKEKKGEHAFILLALSSCHYDYYSFSEHQIFQPAPRGSKNAYKNSIVSMNWLLSEFFEGLDRAGLTDFVSVIGVGDHGEIFPGEYDQVTFGHNLNKAYNLMTHVPFFVVSPELGHKTIAEPSLASLHQVFPTLFDLIGVPRDGIRKGLERFKSFRGESLLVPESPTILVNYETKFPQPEILSVAVFNATHRVELLARACDGNRICDLQPLFFCDTSKEDQIVNVDEKGHQGADALIQIYLENIEMFAPQMNLTL